MGIQKDAGELLVLLYNDKIEDKEVRQEKKIKEETEWEKRRIYNALEYLIGKGLIKGKPVKTMGSSLSVFVLNNGLTSEGVDIIENEDKFKGTFGFGINLGLFKFSWKSK